jgi:hypothetical protein
MKEKKITVVIPSTHSNEELKGLMQNIKDTVGISANVVILSNEGGKSLTELYNPMLEESETDIVVFMHDDIEFMQSGWGEELVQLFSQYQDYGIIGVAGSSTFADHCRWWENEDKYGQVMHKHQGRSWLTIFSQPLKEDLQQTVCVDGLFMAVERTRISQRFDERYQGFHFYDISFCLANFFDGKTKIGVTTNIKILHNSIGEMDEKWEENRKLLLSQYEGKFPIKLKR